MTMTPVQNRLRDGSGPLAEALRRSVQTADVSDEVIERIEQRIMSESGPTTAPSGLGSAKVIGGGFAVAAVVALLGLLTTKSASTPADPQPLQTPTALSAANHLTVTPVPENLSLEPVRATSSLSAKQVALPVRQPEPKVVVTPQAAPVVANAANELSTASEKRESSLNIETRLLQTALSELNVARNPGAALETLESYELRFPKGVFAREASLARIEALVAVGRLTDALARIDALTSAGNLNAPRAIELLLLKTELLAETGQCSAVGLKALESLPTGPLDQRAILVRARCDAELGHVEASRAELDAYLKKYPDGAFAPRARNELNKGP